MPKAIIEDHGNLAIVRMTGVTNAIGPELVADLSGAIGRVKKEHGGMVLAGSSRFFAIGFDLPALLPLNRSEMEIFFEAFNRAVLDIYTLPVPAACAISGHAVAGGHILALAGDRRIMAAGKKRIGLNEIDLGVPVPYLADLMLRQLAGDRTAAEVAFGGELLLSDRAHRLGLVDEVLPEPDVETAALAWAAAMAGKPAAAFAAIKAARVERVVRRFEQRGRDWANRFLDCWFLPETRDRLHAADERF